MLVAKNYPKPYLSRTVTDGRKSDGGKDTSLKEFLKKIQKEIMQKEEARQQIQMAMRSAIRLSKMAILMVHEGRFEEAEKMLKDAESLFSKLSEYAKNSLDLIYSGIVDAAHQEYTEAYIFLKLVKEDLFISSEELGVQMSSYVLGLADVIGELRRKVLDSLREGEIQTAGKYLNLMEQIYIELTGMGDAYFSLPGLRRKCDVARKIIESTRGDVTIEIRRKSLESSIEKLREELEKKT